MEAGGGDGGGGIGSHHRGGGGGGGLVKQQRHSTGRFLVLYQLSYCPHLIIRTCVILKLDTQNILCGMNFLVCSFTTELIEI